tara:strand:+ start:3432 stop:4121 length:690 start_codon:yes stop_codon:yes gene_type:complete
MTIAQRGVKIGYIDTEYILENLTEYSEVSDRLEEKAQSWKDEISQRTREIEQKKESLNSERILLTKDLIEELESEIEFEEQELNDYQQKRFGTRGDLILQKQQLIQPIQDQIFNAIKEIAKSKNYDFIFDKSSDIVMLYSNRRHDISDQILKNISRANNRKKLDTRKDKREAENETIVDESIISEKIEQDIDEKIDNKPENSEPNRKLTVRELLEQRKQKNSNKRKVKD